MTRKLAELNHIDADRNAAHPRVSRVILVGMGLVAVGITASVLYPNLGDDARSATTPASDYRPALGPPCGGTVSAKLITGESTGQGAVLATLKIGGSTTIQAEVDGPPSIRILRGSIVVAAPGSTGGAGSPAQMSNNAAVRPENQVRESDPLMDDVARSQHLTVTFEPTKPGIYPVFFIAQVTRPDRSEGCHQPAPAQGAASRPRTVVQELGSIVAE